jgi:glycosyltransferase involved in cell wall biosynthesis
MKNVLMIGWELPPFNSGGLGVASYYLALHLSKKVNLIFTLPKKLPIKNCPFKILFADNEIKIIEGYLKYKGIIVNGFLEEVLTYGIRLLQKIKEEKIKVDIIHAHDWLGGVAGTFLKDNLNKPLIIHVHATEIERTGNNPNPLIYHLEKECFSKANLIITVSHLTKQIVSEFYGIPPSKIIPLPNGIDLEIPPNKIPQFILELKKHGYKIVLFVGRLVLQKGPDYFIKTLKYVSKFIPKVKYVIAGTGDMFPSLIKIAYEDGVLDKIIFAGFLRDEELWGVYKYSDLLVAPSVFDPFGLVPLEAIKLNVPVIISKTTGLGNYLDHCFKVDFWDIKQMANYIVGTLKYSPLRTELISNSFRELYKFNWEDRANKLVEIYSSL